VKILDRYMVTELGAPFLFGLSAFSLIFAATVILNVSKLVSSEHAPLADAVAYFLWQMPAIVVTVIPMAFLLGVLLALQRLSGESEITAMKAGGISLERAVAPLLVVGFLASFVALVLQEGVVPFANDRANYLREDVIQHINPIATGNLTVVSTSPTGGRQLTSAAGYDATTETLLDTTVIQYDKLGRPSLMIFSKRARYEPPSWTFDDATEYQFDPVEGLTNTQIVPHQTVDIGQRPGQLTQRVANNNPENMSRAQIKEVLSSGQLSPSEASAYRMSYEEKLARPFASFVFTLIALPFGLRQTRGGGTGLGFGLAVAIVFVYFVIASVISAIFTGFSGGPLLSVIGAWLPNVLFTAIGLVLLRRAARY
jgi:lipopolysaccharide export system permease protein